MDTKPAFEKARFFRLRSPDVCPALVGVLANKHGSVCIVKDHPPYRSILTAEYFASAPSYREVEIE